MRTKQPGELEKALVFLAFAGLWGAASLLQLSETLKKTYYDLRNILYETITGSGFEGDFFTEYIRTYKL